MKKIAAMTLALLFVFTSSALAGSLLPRTPAQGGGADTPNVTVSADIDAMSEEELLDLLAQVRLALAKYISYTEDDYVIFENDDAKVVLTGMVFEYDTLKLNVTVENYTDKKISVSLMDMSINGWSTGSPGVSGVPAGKKAKDYFGIWDLEDVELEDQDLDDIGEIEFWVEVYDSDTYDTISVSDTITLLF